MKNLIIGLCVTLVAWTGFTKEGDFAGHAFGEAMPDGLQNISSSGTLLSYEGYLEEPFCSFKTADFFFEASSKRLCKIVIKKTYRGQAPGTGVAEVLAVKAWLGRHYKAKETRMFQVDDKRLKGVGSAEDAIARIEMAGGGLLFVLDYNKVTDEMSVSVVKSEWADKSEKDRIKVEGMDSFCGFSFGHKLEKYANYITPTRDGSAMEAPGRELKTPFRKFRQATLLGGITSHQIFGMNFTGDSFPANTPPYLKVKEFQETVRVISEKYDVEPEITIDNKGKRDEAYCAIFSVGLVSIMLEMKPNVSWQELSMVVRHRQLAQDAKKELSAKNSASDGRDVL